MNVLLNLNIYFDYSYWLADRKLIASSFHQSSILNSYYKYLYSKNRPIQDNYIKSGPQKLINNLIKAYKDKSDVVFNQPKFNNYYFCTYLDKHREFLINVLNSNSKVVVGPLYTNEGFLNLVKLTKRYQNLKIVAASEVAKSTIIKISDKRIDQKNIVILPVGIGSKDEILKKQQNISTLKKEKCLIYFKGRKKSELEKIENLLDDKHISNKVFEYGNYKSEDLIEFAKIAKFAIILGRSESQGIGINELMSYNLPMLVIDAFDNFYNNQIYPGTTVPYWSNLCGMKVSDIQDFEKNIDVFLKSVDDQEYQPNKYVLETLTFEIMSKNLEGIFKSISF